MKQSLSVLHVGLYFSSQIRAELSEAGRNCLTLRIGTTSYLTATILQLVRLKFHFS